MQNLARLLVADDLDRETKDQPTPILEMASELADALKSEIHLVHAYDIPRLAIPPEKMALLETPYVDEMTRALESESDTIRESHPKLKIVPEVEKGDTVQVLLNDAAAHSCDVVVLGTHGRRGVRRALLGSVAEEVIRRSPVPVLSINPHVSEVARYRPTRIMVALDPTEGTDRVVDIARDFSRAFSAPVFLLHVIEEWIYPIVQSASLLAGGYVMPLEKDLQELANQRFAQLEELKLRLASEGVTVETKLIERARSVGEAIVSEASSGKCDLIVMGHHHASRLEYALLGSVNRFVVREAQCPVLTVAT